MAELTLAAGATFHVYRDGRTYSVVAQPAVDGTGQQLVEGGFFSKAAAQQAARQWAVDFAAATTCRWFARCGRPATGVTPHPVLGDVLTCDRCHTFATGEVR